MRGHASSTRWALAAVPFGLILLHRDSLPTGAQVQCSESPSTVELAGTVEAGRVLERSEFSVAGRSHYQATLNEHDEDIHLVSEVASMMTSVAI